jgi:flagellar P-ring protein precursor FlgI
MSRLPTSQVLAAVQGLPGVCRRLLPGLLLPAFLLAPLPGVAQEVSVGDLTHLESDVPVRLMGYGLVVGLDGTGDRILGGASGGGMTVRSVANLLRRFDIEVPDEMLRTRNVAAVLVTAETSAWTRPGGRFAVQVASLGDATSLRGGVLWMTPMVADPGGPALATAQGGIVVAGPTDTRLAGRYRGETSAEIAGGGIMEVDLPRNGAMDSSRLLLTHPDLGMAERIARAVNEAYGEGTAVVEDPGSVRVERTPEGPSLHDLRTVRLENHRAPRILVDSRDGTVVAGGGIRIGEAVVSHEGITLSIDATVDAATPANGPPLPGAGGEVRVAQGATVQEVATALHAVGASAGEIAAILRGLREIGALRAEVVLR